MKKFLLSLAALAVGVAANAADYYLIGGFNGYKEADATAKFVEAADGTYTLDYEGTLTSGFKINDGTWTNNNANWGGNAVLTLGEVYNLDLGGSSGNIPLDADVVNPHLVFNPTASTLIVTGQSQEAVYSYGIHGDVFGVSSWSTENMTEENGKWVLANKTVVAGGFGVKKMAANGAQVDWISSDGAAAVVLDTAMPCKVEGTNWTIGAGTYTFTFDPEAMTLTVTGEGGGDDPEPVYVTTLYIIGEPAGGWAPNVGEKLEGSEGVFTYNADFSAVTYFGFATELAESAQDWDTLNAHRYGSALNDEGADTYTLVGAGTYDMGYPNATSWNLPAGKYTFTIDTNAKTLKVDGTAGVADIEAAEDVPAVYYNLQGVRVANPANGLFLEVRGNQVRKVAPG